VYASVAQARPELSGDDKLPGGDKHLQKINQIWPSGRGAFPKFRKNRIDLL
jgi:hypothetical protein